MKSISGYHADLWPVIHQGYVSSTFTLTSPESIILSFGRGTQYAWDRQGTFFGNSSVFLSSKCFMYCKVAAIWFPQRFCQNSPGSHESSFSSVLLSSCCGGRHGRDRQAAKGSEVKLKPHNCVRCVVVDWGGASLPPSAWWGGCEIPQDYLEEIPWKSLYFAQKLEAKQKAS